MKTILKEASLLFSAGCAGGLVNALTVWAFGVLQISQSLGVMISPRLSPQFIYTKTVWGGLWAFLFFLPILKNKVSSRALVISLAPSFYQLYTIFPQQGYGLLGLNLGSLTPVLVLFFNFIWAFTALKILKQTI